MDSLVSRSLGQGQPAPPRGTRATAGRANADEPCANTKIACPSRFSMRFYAYFIVVARGLAVPG